MPPDNFSKMNVKIARLVRLWVNPALTTLPHSLRSTNPVARSHGLSVAAPTVWNSLPSDIRDYPYFPSPS